MAAQYFVQFLFLAAGIIAILAAVMDWNWFFHSNNAQFIIQNLGRKKARLLYGALGVLAISVGIYLFFQ